MCHSKETTTREGEEKSNSFQDRGAAKGKISRSQPRAVCHTVCERRGGVVH